MKKRLKKTLGILLATTSILALPTAVFAEDATTAPAETTTIAAAPLDLDGTYHARLGFQAMTADSILWLERLGYYDLPDGDLPHSGKEITNDYKEYEATFTDAVIEGNGTYTVSMTADSLADVAEFTQLQVSTDIPKSDSITYSNLIVKVNGIQQANYSSVYVDEDKVSGQYDCLLAFNNWRADLKADASCMDPKCIPTGTAVTFELTFTVSGFNYDKVSETTVAPGTTDVSSNDESSSSVAVAVGPMLLVGGAVILLAVAAIVIVVVVVSKKK